MGRAIVLLSFGLLCALGAWGCTVNVTSVPVGSVAEDGSVYLGFSLITRKPDKDFILVGGEHGTFSSLRVHVTGHDLHLERMVVVFGNGERWEPAIRPQFAKGSWSREINLPGHARQIERVVFVGRSTHTKAGMAKVELYGRR